MTNSFNMQRVELLVEGSKIKDPDSRILVADRLTDMGIDECSQ